MGERQADLPSGWTFHPPPLGVAVVTGARRGEPAGALLLDRDGTLILDDHYPTDLKRIRLVPSALRAMHQARSRGWALALISNQGGLALGRFGWRELGAVHRAMAAGLARAGLTLDLSLYCPYHPEGSAQGLRYEAPLRGRKPAPGMVDLACRRLAVGPGDPVLMVGDKESDVAAARAAGIAGLRVACHTWEMPTPEPDGWAAVESWIAAARPGAAWKETAG